MPIYQDLLCWVAQRMWEPEMAELANYCWLRPSNLNSDGLITWLFYTIQKLLYRMAQIITVQVISCWLWHSNKSLSESLIGPKCIKLHCNSTVWTLWKLASHQGGCPSSSFDLQLWLITFSFPLFHSSCLMCHVQHVSAINSTWTYRSLAASHRIFYRNLN